MSTESSPDDIARRAFLTQIEALLSLSAIAWTSIEYRTLRIYKSVGLVVTAPGMPGEAHILAVSIYNGRAIDYVRFPGEGIPHYQLLIRTEQGISGGYRVSCDPAVIISALCAWATSLQAPMKRIFAPLNEHDLLPLQRRAMIRASIQQRVQALLSRGVDRCSETMMDEVGLVHDSVLQQLAQGLTNVARERLDEDLHYLASDLVMSHFPLQEDGRFPPGGTVLLASYESHLSQSRDRQMWLVACAPKRRSDQQVVTLSLASLIGVNHAYRWDQARWLWDVRHDPASEEVRWGVSGLTPDTLGLDQRADHLAFFAKRCSLPDPSLTDRVSLCLLLQDEGRIEEAFSLFDVELTPDVLKILYGQPVTDDPSGGHYMSKENWAIPMLHALRRAAPWRFASALATGKRLRLLWFPHQTQQRKASLMLTWANKHMRTPALEIEWTASNRLLAETAWKRPLDLDLNRFHPM
ncbi:MAG TPA: hypothetical protein VGN34_19490, partial [Ktedonobacteraceae bacterium]